MWYNMTPGKGPL